MLKAETPRFATWLALVALAGLVSVAPVSAAGQAPATARTEVTVQPGPRAHVRPGPDALYSRSDSPLLQNVGIWRAKPIMVSGASAYRHGEFLYQDFLFDESGSYPAMRAYSSQNNADLVELRLKPTAHALALRLTLNSMQDFADVGATIALGGDPTQLHAAPHGANARMPAQLFVTVHGTTGDIVDAATGAVSRQVPKVSVDVHRRQVEVRIPFTAFDPRGKTVRVAAAVGLWDRAAHAYRPQANGAAAFMNVAFRYTETPRTPYPPSWRNTLQGAALQAGDLSLLSASVDFTKLASGIDDDMTGETGGVPRTGLMSRIYASRYEQQQGRGPYAASTPPFCHEPCPSQVVDFPGQLQPYTLDVPTTPRPARGYGLVYHPHASGWNYNQNLSAPQVTANALNALVVYPEGRGTSYWYWSLAATDVFEAVGDVMRAYRVDRDRVTIAGLSMGGYGTYRLSATWPDLFAAMAPVVGCTAAETEWAGPPTPNQSGPAADVHGLFRSWRNIPILSDTGSIDTTCNATAAQSLFAEVDNAGYRYEWRQYPGDHTAAPIEAFAADAQQWNTFLADKRVVRDPIHVTYVYNVRSDQREFGLNADHAYWLSGLVARQRSGTAPGGVIDVFSHGFGRADPKALPTQPIAGLGYTGLAKSWGSAPAIRAADTLDIVAMGISAVTIDVARAHVSCNPRLNVTSDGPIKITLAGCR